MGKKGNWFHAVKKALSPESKEKKAQVGDLLYTSASFTVSVSLLKDFNF